MTLDSVGVYCWQLRFMEPHAANDIAREIEDLGYTAIWLASAHKPGVVAQSSELLNATERIKVATGVLTIWEQEPESVAVEVGRIEAEQPGRFLLGLGVSHSENLGPAEQEGMQAPVQALNAYLDTLERTGATSLKDNVLLGAQGPKMLELARTRTAGACPYNVTAAHTKSARKLLGPDALLATMVPAIFRTDTDEARTIARAALAPYLNYRNYLSNWRRLGFGEQDFADGGSDALIDAVYAYGTPDEIAARIIEHLTAGADHVYVQVLTEVAWPNVDLSETRGLWRDLSLALALSA